MALGTEDGHVLWTVDGGDTVHEARAMSARRYDPVPIRSGERARFALPGANEAAADLPAAARRKRRKQYTHEEMAKWDREPRSILLFLANLQEGNPHARWAVWMALTDPWTNVTSLSMPHGDGAMALSTPSGVLVSDANRGVWTRTLGGPGQMPRERDLVPMAVAIDPADSQHVLAGTDRGVMISHDGGQTFFNHTDAALSDVFVTKFIWSADVPREVYAVAGDSVLASEDSGGHFEPTFSSQQEITDMALSGQKAGYVATKNGLHVLSGQRSRRLLQGRDFIAVAPWHDGTALAATPVELYLISPDGTYRRLLETIESDRFVGLAGGGRCAWLVSRRGVLRIGDPIERADQTPGYRAPRLLLSQAEMERVVMNHYGIGPPIETRLHDRWYAKLIPGFTVQVRGVLAQHQSTLRVPFPDYPLYVDPILASESYNQNGAWNNGRVEWVVWAHWDLSKFVFGNTSNATNANLVVEQQIREKRRMVLEEVRWHYREAAGLTHQLQRPPADPALELLWRMRLEELSSYLAYLSGRPVVEGNELEPSQ
jgi:hypothetical protein